MATKQEPLYDIEDDMTIFIQGTDSLCLPFDDLNSINIVPGAFNGLNLSPSTVQDETLDVAEKCLMSSTYFPVTRYGPPQRGVFKGALNFEVQVNSSNVHKRKYLYSNKLNRIYVDMGSNFSMQFRWDFEKALHPMFVRATTVFSNDTQAEKRVERCLQHKHASNGGNDPLMVHHVLRSTRDCGTPGVFYCGTPERADSWFSVLVQFPASPDGPTPVFSHAYQFVCKNSCSSGINRRAIDIVFTLEDDTGKVHGCHTVGARVCACPQRDMLKDEKTEYPAKKRTKSELPVPPPVKKIKMEVCDADDAVYTLPAGIQIVGAKTMSTGLTVMKNMMEQMSACKKNDVKAQEKLAAAIASVQSVLEQFK